MNKIIHVTLKSQIMLQKSEIPPHILSEIRIYLTMDNPKYQEAEERGYYTGNIPQYIFAFTEDENYLYISRGYIGGLLSHLVYNGLKYQLIDNRRKLPEIALTFHGNLRPYQEKAVDSALKKDFGIIVAPCGSGKTVMACSIIAERKQPTLIIVHTKELLHQWVDRISQYLGLPPDQIGIIGDGRFNIKPVTVALVQTLCKRDLKEINKYFGQIIIDECHHTPSTTFTEVVTAFDSYYMLGLSATPYRRDRLNKLIFLTIGNVTAEIKESELRDLGDRIKPQVIARQTDFYYDYQEDSDYVPMIV